MLHLDFIHGNQPQRNLLLPRGSNFAIPDLGNGLTAWHLVPNTQPHWAFRRAQSRSAHGAPRHVHISRRLATACLQLWRSRSGSNTAASGSKIENLRAQSFRSACSLRTGKSGSSQTSRRAATRGVLSGLRLPTASPVQGAHQFPGPSSSWPCSGTRHYFVIDISYRRLAEGT